MGKKAGFSIGNVLTHKEAAAFYTRYFAAKEGEDLSNNPFYKEVPENSGNFSPDVSLILGEATYTPEVLKVQHLLPTFEATLSDQLSQIKKISPYLYHLSPEKKEEYHRTLCFIIYLYYLQYQLDTKKTRRKVDIAKYAAGIKECHDLIIKLETKPQSVEQAVAESTKPLAYLGIDAGLWLKDQVIAMASNQYKEFVVGKTKSVKNAMGELNEERLQWVWSKAFLLSILAGFAKNIFTNAENNPIFKHFHFNDAIDTINTTSIYTGYLSFLLYYARGAIHLGLLLNNTFKGPLFEREVIRLEELPIDETTRNQYKYKYIWLPEKVEDESEGEEKGESEGEDSQETSSNYKGKLYYVDENANLIELTLDGESEKLLAKCFLDEDVEAIKFSIDEINSLGAKITGSDKAHTPWTVEELKDMQAWERFKTQWKMRKFALLNDWIWATANMACFYWLVSGSAGLIGNGLTGALLIMDLSLAVWMFYEESTQHNKLIQDLDDKIKQLNGERDKAQNELDQLEEIKKLGDLDDLQTTRKKQLEKEIEAYNHQLQLHEKAKLKAEFEWRYQKYKLINLLGYSAGLLLAFSIANTFYLPQPLLISGFAAAGITVSPLVLFSVGVGGAALCAVFTIINAAINGGIDIAKSRASVAELKKEYAILWADFNKKNNAIKALGDKTELTADEAKNLNKLIQQRSEIYLNLKGLEIDIGYHKNMAIYHAAGMVRSMAIDAMVPLFAFATFALLMPTLGIPISLAIIAAALVVVVTSKIIMKQFQPSNAKTVDYQEDEFQAFCKEPTNPFELKANGKFFKELPKPDATEMTPVKGEEGTDKGELIPST